MKGLISWNKQIHGYEVFTISDDLYHVSNCDTISEGLIILNLFHLESIHVNFAHYNPEDTPLKVIDYPDDKGDFYIIYHTEFNTCERDIESALMFALEQNYTRVKILITRKEKI